MRSINGIEAPCYQCVNRHAGCHSSCEPYKEYCKACAEERQRIYAKKAEVKMMDDFQFRCVERTKKRMGSKKPFGQR